MNGSLNRAAGGGGGFGAAVIPAGFDLKAKQSVDLPVKSILTKANDWPEVGEWASIRPTTVPLGQDKRFLYPFLPTTNVEARARCKNQTKCSIHRCWGCSTWAPPASKQIPSLRFGKTSRLCESR